MYKMNKMNKYYRNFIVCREIDFYCVICQEMLTDVEKHIRWEKHRKLVKTQALHPKYKKEHVYKIGNIFYCEFCNSVTTPEKINDHINSESHKANKDNPEDITKKVVKTERSGDGVTVSNFVVNRDHWHTIVNNHCFICNSTVDNVDKHISLPIHMINLMQTDAVFEQDDRNYRKIGDNLNFCFICYVAFDTDNFESHWTSEEHCKEKERKETEKNKQASIDEAQEKNSEVARRLFDSQRVNYDIDLTIQAAICKICKAYVEIHYKSLVDHRKVHNRTAADMEEIVSNARKAAHKKTLAYIFFDHGKNRQELAEFGRKHYIKLNEGGKIGYCWLCNNHMSAHFKVFREHITGACHVGHLEVKGIIKRRDTTEKPKYKSEVLRHWLKSIQRLDNDNLVFLNREFCINPLSFVFVTPVNDGSKSNSGRMLCYICDIIYREGKAQHLKEQEHNEKILKTHVITTITDEFVREIRPSLYHCGYCNMRMPSWNLLTKHFLSPDHKTILQEKMIENEIAKTAVLHTPIKQMTLRELMNMYKSQNLT